MPAVDAVDNDSQLVARAQGGDEDAFAELFRRHSELVFRLALSILGQGFAAEAEDVAQEVFLKVHQNDREVLDQLLADLRQESCVFCRLEATEPFRIQKSASPVAPFYAVLSGNAR